MSFADGWRKNRGKLQVQGKEYRVCLWKDNIQFCFERRRRLLFLLGIKCSTHGVRSYKANQGLRRYKIVENNGQAGRQASDEQTAVLYTFAPGVDV